MSEACFAARAESTFKCRGEKRRTQNRAMIGEGRGERGGENRESWDWKGRMGRAKNGNVALIMVFDIGRTRLQVT